MGVIKAFLDYIMYIVIISNSGYIVIFSVNKYFRPTYFRVALDVNHPLQYRN